MNNNVSFDAMVQMAARESIYRQLNSLPSQKELEKMYTVSKSHEKKITKLIKSENLFEKLIKFNKQFSKVATILFIVFTVTFTPLISAKAVRESIVQTVIEWKEEFVSIFFKSEITPAVINDVKIGYMPEGFESDGNAYQSEYEYRESFVLENRYINIFIFSEDNTLAAHIDNEYSNYYSIIIDGNYGLWVDREEFSALVISDNNFIYRVDGNTDIGKLIEIYKNIEIF